LLDNVIMRLTDIAFAIPALPLLIILSSYVKSLLPMMVLIIGLLSWMGGVPIGDGHPLGICLVWHAAA
jgi:ABC-type dipeptide/oligopeptide/nickel transport system permease subunit